MRCTHQKEVVWHSAVLPLRGSVGRTSLSSKLIFSYYKARYSSLCDSPLSLWRPRLTVGLNDHQDHLFHPTWFCGTKGLHTGLYVYWQKHRENCTLDDSNCSCVSHSCGIDVTLVWGAAGKKGQFVTKLDFWN